MTTIIFLLPQKVHKIAAQPDYWSTDYWSADYWSPAAIMNSPTLNVFRSFRGSDASGNSSGRSTRTNSIRSTRSNSMEKSPTPLVANLLCQDMLDAIVAV